MVQLEPLGQRAKSGLAEQPDRLAKLVQLVNLELQVLQENRVAQELQAKLAQLENSAQQEQLVSKEVLVQLVSRAAQAQLASWALLEQPENLALQVIEAQRESATLEQLVSKGLWGQLALKGLWELLEQLASLAAQAQLVKSVRLGLTALQKPLKPSLLLMAQALHSAQLMGMCLAQTHLPNTWCLLMARTSLLMRIPLIPCPAMAALHWRKLLQFTAKLQCVC
jgi:hypothetical protein